MGATKDFFKEKRSWSIFKDKILDYYLAPYLPKILKTGRPVVIFDCFAGKGKFDDGQYGSPIIIAERMQSALAANPVMSGKIQGYFIEKKYHHDLRNNIRGYPNTNVLDGTFEENLAQIANVEKNSSIFLYIDPYGVKNLNFENFRQLADKNFFSLELLLNFNSAGFLREGCRLLKHEILVDEEEFSDYECDEGINTIDNMNSIAGGEYWQDILHNYFKREFNIYSAEDIFVQEYSRKLGEIFNYVVNIPIKLKSIHLPKYRLLFASNHQDGLILMVDNMHKKWEQMIAEERNGQGVLFEFVFPTMAVDGETDIRKDVIKFVSTSETVSMKDVIVRLMMKYGITFSETYYKKVIEAMEGGELVIERTPSYTPKTKKPVKSLNYNKFKISLRRNLS
jgi:three-Cys-motif partner protein